MAAFLLFVGAALDCATLTVEREGACGSVQLFASKKLQARGEADLSRYLWPCRRACQAEAKRTAGEPAVRAGEPAARTDGQSNLNCECADLFFLQEGATRHTARAATTGCWHSPATPRRLSDVYRHDLYTHQSLKFNDAAANN